MDGFEQGIGCEWWPVPVGSGLLRGLEAWLYNSLPHSRGVGSSSPGHIDRVCFITEVE